MAGEGIHYPIGFGHGLNGWLHWRAYAIADFEAGEPVKLYPAGTHFRAGVVGGTDIHRFGGIATTAIVSGSSFTIMTAGYTVAWASGGVSAGNLLAPLGRYMKKVTLAANDTNATSQWGCAIALGTHTAGTLRKKIPMMVLPWRVRGKF